jgi:fatty-acyl-CoA synthase
MHLLKTWQARGVRLTQGYGQTESAGTFITLLFPEDAERKIGFAGQAMPQVQIQIVDADDNPLPPNAAGEILVRSPAMMSGYLNQPAQTAAAFKNGWLHTGDIGLLDEEGYLKIVDRAKDMLISGGLNVYPAEIEKTLGGVPGLAEFAVIGVPDERWGEVPMVVVPHVEAVDLAMLRARCKTELADYKRPKYIAGYGSTMPRTYSGKITKAILREIYPAVPADAVLLKG